MDDRELKEVINRNPGTILEQAYKLGRKEANLELSAAIAKGEPRNTVKN
jgi:hypothetical protein